MDRLFKNIVCFSTICFFFMINTTVFADVHVNNKQELKTAFADQSVTKIILDDDITINEYLTVKLINKDLIIDGKGHRLLSDRGYSINLSGNKQMIISDIILGSVGNASGYYLFNGKSSQVNFSLEDVTTTKNNNVGLAITDGKIQILNNNKHSTEWYLDSNTDRSSNSLLSSGSFLLLNSDLSVNVNKGSFFYSSGRNNVEFEVNNSKLNNVSQSSITNIYIEGIATKMKFLNNSNINIRNESSSTAGIDSSGMIWGIGNSYENTGMTFTIDSSEVDFYSKGMSALVFKGRSSSFYLNNNSDLFIESDEIKDGASGKYPSIRYGFYGGATFKIDNNSEMYIKKNRGQSAGIRMVDDDNKVLVAGGSRFKVYNAGSPGDTRWNYSQAIEYGDGAKKNLFELQDKGSTVDLDAQNGGAITSRGDAKIIMHPETTFSAVGHAAYTTFSATELTMILDSPRYFDFSNTYVGKSIVETNSATSEMNLTNSLLSIWDKNNDIMTTTPLKSFNKLNLRLNGVNFSNIVSTTNSDFNSTIYKSMNNLSRINANNSKPVIDHIIQPTNADKFIFVHASVPQKYDELRDAFEDEVTVEGRIILPNDDEFIFKGKTASSMEIYGKKDQKGYAKISVPKSDFLVKGSKIVIDRAYRGEEETKIEAIKIAPPVEVINVIPPKLAEINNKFIQSSDEILSGTGTPQATVLLKVNNEWLNNTSIVNSEGKFTIELPRGLKKGDIIQVFLRDQEKKLNISDPPITNTIDGNINPSEDLKYHDAIFSGAPKLKVGGSLSFQSVPAEINFGTIKTSGKLLELSPLYVSGNLVIHDDRDEQVKSEWRLLLKTGQQFVDNTDSSKVLSKSSWLYKNKIGNNILITDQFSIIESSLNFQGAISNISDTWGENKGLELRIPVENQLVGEYEGTLEWQLESVPSND
ncbi:pectate lyase-like adhesive domain-containing protein [Vagococcus luciliae]|uniref:Bacterial Ig domain-containing protein n=1 Tax=Vagococcus luciliae TaxID=2920380 RepID=A0ABY5NXE9_9ENTE|nr:pectate lyase-like adhesive domain-containing protein [Vagococcus luciliae]UUV98326.1 hypothetical protein G314FT_04420 [Vagococcus luciliae]